MINTINQAVAPVPVMPVKPHMLLPDRPSEVVPIKLTVSTGEKQFSNNQDTAATTEPLEELAPEKIATFITGISRLEAEILETYKNALTEYNDCTHRLREAMESDNSSLIIPILEDREKIKKVPLQLQQDFNDAIKIAIDRARQGNQDLLSRLKFSDEPTLFSALSRDTQSLFKALAMRGEFPVGILSEDISDNVNALERASVLKCFLDQILIEPVAFAALDQPSFKMFVDLVSSSISKDPGISLKLLAIGQKRIDFAKLITQNIFDNLLKDQRPYNQQHDSLNEIIELIKTRAETEAEIAKQVSEAIPVAQALNMLFRVDNSQRAGADEKKIVLNSVALRGFVNYLNYAPAAKAELTSMLNDEVKTELLVAGFKNINVFNEVCTILKCGGDILDIKIFERAFNLTFPGWQRTQREGGSFKPEEKHYANFIKLFLDGDLILNGVGRDEKSDVQGWDAFQHILNELSPSAKQYMLNFRFKMEYLNNAIQFYKFQDSALDLHKKNLEGKTGLQDFYEVLKDIRDHRSRPMLCSGSEQFEYEDIDADGTKTKTIYCNNILTPKLAGLAIQTLNIILGENN